MATQMVEAHYGDYAFPTYELATWVLPDLHDGTLGNKEDVQPVMALPRLERFSIGRNPLDEISRAAHIPALQERGVGITITGGLADQ